MTKHVRGRRRRPRGLPGGIPRMVRRQAPVGEDVKIESWGSEAFHWVLQVGS